MKYIIFEDNKTGMRHPVVFGNHTTHSQIKVDGCKAISAGNFKIDDFGGVIVYGSSPSLNLSPSDGDDNLIYLAINDFGTFHFMKI